MRLFPRILFSQAAPSLVLTLALALILVALVRLTVMLGHLKEQELGALETDSQLHRAGWAADLSLRHGREWCGGDVSADDRSRIRAVITRGFGDLRAALAQRPEASPDLRRVALQYGALGDRVLGGDVCDNLRTAAVEQERARLDEDLTNRWVDRLAELNRALQQKDGEARALGKLASAGGIALAVIAFVVASVLARRLAGEVSGALRELSELARRIGRGDFHGRIDVTGPAEVTALAQDLERMRARLAELESLKQGFLASISHELRTPLTKIREALALLADGVTGPLEAPQARVVEIARVACEREIRMVCTLLDLSRLRAGAELVLRAGVGVDAVLHAAVNDEVDDARAHRVSIEIEHAGEAPTASLDAVLLERAIANLVRNAVAVSKAGQRVRVRRDVLDVGPHGQRGRWARVAVEDAGPGVPDELRETLFDPFITRAVPRSPKMVGVGLGLSLAREVARAHDGDLRLHESGPGGSTFHLWVPLAGAPQRPEPSAPKGASLESTT